MPNSCGGIRLDGVTLKVINGVICNATADSVNIDDAVSTCGQLWDGASFKVERVNGCPVITLLNASGIVEKTLGNCGVGLDGRFFKVSKGVVNLQNGFVLTVNATPSDSIIKVIDVDSVEVAPITGTTNTFLLSDLGDSYTLTVSKTGFTTKTQAIVNNGDQTIEVTLEAAG